VFERGRNIGDKITLLKELEMKELEGNGILTQKLISKFENNFRASPANKAFMNAVTRGTLTEIALNRDILNSIHFCFSNEIETTEVTNQKQSNTCWLFAELNWLRTFVMKKINVKSFEFSQNYVIFFDKIEKSNYFFENIIATSSKPIDDREIAHLLHEPANDGGEWHMMANLIKKYGLLPKSVMPDTSNRENTRYLNEILYYKLRQGAMTLRKLHKSGKSVEQLRKKKIELMDEVYRILAICLGVPPAKFDWSYRNEDKAFVRETQITPVEFYNKYVELNPDEVYCLMSCPSESTEFNKTYSVKYFTNMSGGYEYIWINLPLRELKKIAVKMIKKGDACLFGCDVIQQSNSKEGILDRNLYDYELIFGTSFDMDKPTRVDSGQTRLTHSMVLTGVDLVDNKPIKWKIENSWGDTVGKKGFFIMSDEWFDEHVYDLIVPKKYMTAKMLGMFEEKPIELPPWHAMA
jgi:bleomycin hydrolase